MNREKIHGFFASRWRSEADLSVLLWRDVLFFGTLINLVAGFAAFVMISRDLAPLWALAVHLAPVPYNGFLLLAVWRSRQSTPAVSLVAGIWFVAMLIF